MGEYNERVLVGDWFEKLQLKQDARNGYIEKKKNNLLLTQKTNQAKDNLLRATETRVHEDRIVRYGDTVQLMSSQVNSVLSGLISHRHVYNIQDLAPGCMLSGTQHISPCIRNVFKIESTSEDGKAPKPLRYGDDFYLFTTSKSLYVHCDIPNINTLSGLSKHPVLTLSATKSSHCRWHIIGSNHYEEEDLVGSIIHVNEPMRVNHSASNRQLALESEYQFYTMFGVETEVSVHTYTEKSINNNVWMFRAPESNQDRFIV